MKRMTTALVLTAALTATPASAHAASCRNYVDLGRQVGWAKRDRGQLERIMYRESRCNPRSINPNDPHGGSYGLLQINGSWLGYLRRAGLIRELTDLLDARTNLRVGAEIHRLYGWRPWGTHPSQQLEDTRHVIQP